jgi:hypothetical protein
MKTVLFTGYDQTYEPLADLTIPFMRQYAAKRQMDFEWYDKPPEGLNIYWTGIARGLDLFGEGYDAIMYLDADQLITNLDAPWPPVMGGFHASRDWGKDATEPWHFSACGWIAHRDCIPMFEQVLDMEPKWRNRPFQEQGPWQAVVRMMLKDQIILPGQVENGRVKEVPAGLINILPRRIFNAVPDEVCPGKVLEPWSKGDLACHITMVPIERRVEIAKRILKELEA